MKDIPRLARPCLEVRDLRVAVALAQAGSTSGAASLLHLTQPAVSRALIGLEHKLDARLFERKPRGLSPNARGEIFVAHAARLLAEIGDLEQRVRTASFEPARLRIVCECYTAYHWLPTALDTLEHSLQELSIELAVEHTRDPVTALHAGEIDAALLTSAEVTGADLEQRPLFSDEVVFVVAASHPLARKAAITASDIRRHTLLTSDGAAGEAQWFLRQVFGRRRPRLSFQRFPLTEPILDMARAGLGIAVLSEWIASPHLARGELVAKRLAPKPLHRPWRLAWRREVRDPALRLLQALTSSVPRARLAG